jgi:hypothetical protein
MKRVSDRISVMSFAPTKSYDRSEVIDYFFKHWDSKEGSLFGDNKDIEEAAKVIEDPQTDHVVDPNSPEGIKYGPDGKIIVNKNRKELFGDW